MRAFTGFIFLMLAVPAFAQDRRIEVDPNTKIEGGADVRGSGANAGATTPPENKIEDRIPVDKRAPEKDEPISERKPQEQEREREEPAKRESAPQR
jgi:hypothetical protein